MPATRLVKRINEMVRWCRRQCKVWHIKKKLVTVNAKVDYDQGEVTSYLSNYFFSASSPVETSSDRKPSSHKNKKFFDYLEYHATGKRQLSY